MHVHPNVENLPKAAPPAPSINQMIRVWIPGERLWAECVAVYGDGSWDGRIHNEPKLTASHGFQFDSVTRFIAYPEARRCPWQALRFAGPDDKREALTRRAAYTMACTDAIEQQKRAPKSLNDLSDAGHRRYLLLAAVAFESFSTAA